VFPLIQTGPGHFLVDRDDFPVRSKLGHRPAVAVERRANDEFAIVIAGDVCRDPRETMGGLLHGSDENQQLLIGLSITWQPQPILSKRAALEHIQYSTNWKDTWEI